MYPVARTEENLRKCLCADCPSYTVGCKVKNYPLNAAKRINGIENAEHYEKMFCSFGKSTCIDEDRGCLCDRCEVFAENDLVREEYCLADGGLECAKCKYGFEVNQQPEWQ